MNNIQTTLDYFKQIFGDNPKCELNYASDIEYLVAVLLSAQCTDRRVNIVTKQLFAKYKCASDYAQADIKELQKLIYSTGFYRNKSHNIINLCKSIINDYGGTIPTSMEELTTLPGVGRKTASVFISEFHKLPAVPVDTHIIRVSNRLQFSSSQNPNIIENDLKSMIPMDLWSKWHLYMVLFGRYHCVARNPKCFGCKLRDICNKA